MTRSRIQFFAIPLAFATLTAHSAFAAATIQIVTPLDQASVNSGGGSPAPVEVTYQVTGNTCIGVKSSFNIVPYVNGVPVDCSGTGCSCDGTSGSCNNITRTITLDGNDFGSCLNTIRISLDNAPFTQGILVSRTYDALDRPLTVSYPDSSLNVTHSYDSTMVPFGIGRRTSTTDASGSTVFHYDRRGLRRIEEKTINSVTFTTQYVRDKTGNETQVLYPTNDPAQRQGAVAFTFDAADRTTAVTAAVNGVMTGVASGIAYKPFGPTASQPFSNGRTDSRTFDTRYRLGNWTLGGLLSYTHGYDDDDNLMARLDNLNAANDRGYGYDEVHRLTNASGPWGTGTGCTLLASYEYDLNGNRTCKSETAPSTTYTYATGTNHIATAMGAEAASYSHDMSGNVTGDGTHTYEFDDADRLASVDGNATATYTYDGEGRRAIKTAGGKTTHYFYHPDGRLLTELVLADETGKDYIYLDGTPLARVDWTAQELSLGDVLTVTASAPNVHLDWTAFPAGSNRYVVRRKQIVDFSDKIFNGNVVIATPQDPGRTHDDPVLGDANTYFYRVSRRVLNDTLYFYHADHLGTPIAMTETSGSIVWRAEHRPFGGIHNLPVSAVTNTLRFSGQYFDSETGLHQNWFRDYDTAIGRYREPDPLADLSYRSLLSPAIETELFSPWYTYVGGNPTNYIDPLGLLRFKGCLPEREQAVRVALKEYCGRIEMPSFTGCMCSKASIPGRLKRQCEDPDLTVRCKSTSGGLCRGACAWSIPFGSTIRICERAWKPGCGPLGCTLVHEMTHQIGHFREKRPRQVEECLGCP